MDSRSCLERTRGVWQSGRSLRSSAAVPLQRGVRSEKARTASTKGSDGGGVSRASSIWRGVQFKAGVAVLAQARVVAWRVVDEVSRGGQAKAWLTAVQRAPRIAGKACCIVLATS
jgi:hypothetical protein